MRTCIFLQYVCNVARKILMDSTVGILVWTCGTIGIAIQKELTLIDSSADYHMICQQKYFSCVLIEK